MLILDPILFILAAILLLLIPFPWLIAMILAALLHETAHILALLCLGGHVEKIRLDLNGARIDASSLEGNNALISILAGPMASFSLFLFCRVYPELAICALLQGLFNMLPVYPLDGGRILENILRRTAPEQVSLGLSIAHGVVLCGFTAMTVAGIYYRNVHFSLPGIVTVFTLLRKTPCKQRRIKVQ